MDREKPTNVVLPMCKGQVITALPKLQLSQTTVSTGTTNVSQQLVQALQPIPPPPAIQMNSVVPVNEPSTQILIIMPDKTKRMFILNQQNKDYKIQDLVTELGISPNDITINIKIGSQTASDEDLDEENQREEEEMALPETEEEVSSQEPQDDQGEEESV